MKARATYLAKILGKRHLTVYLLKVNYRKGILRLVTL